MMLSWINHLSYGGLIIPNSYFKEINFRTKQLFNKLIKYQIPKGLNVVTKLSNKIFSRILVEKKFKVVI